ncbi:MAG: DUF3048 domain-containing protein [Actinomycetota bacterium]
MSAAQTRLRTTLVACVLSGTVLAGCSSPSQKVVVAPSPTPKPTPTVVAVNPLTGLPPLPTGPVIAVKVDDTAAGRPSLGLEKADVIYIEEAEGGLSRMMAVFAGAKPKVRAVRSVRASDPELLGQYGKIIFVASGGGGSSLPTLDHSDLLSVINDRGQVGFNRDPSRPAPYNLESDLAKVSAAVKGPGVRDVGFTWAALDPRLATATAAPTVSTRVGSTTVSFVWDPAAASYVRTVDGRPLLAASGAPVAKPNVLVQYCEITADRSDVDVKGNPSKYTHTTGTGRVVLFRNGKRIVGTWSRPGITARTTFKDAAGKPLLLARGGTFVALVSPGAPS